MQKIYNNISLAYKANKLILGTEEIVSNIQKGKQMIVFINRSASINSFKLSQNKSIYYDVDVIILNDVEENFKRIFKEKQIKIIAIKNKGFRKLMLKNIKEQYGEN